MFFLLLEGENGTFLLFDSRVSLPLDPTDGAPENYFFTSDGIFFVSKKVLFLFRLLSSRLTKGDTHNNILKEKMFFSIF